MVVLRAIMFATARNVIGRLSQFGVTFMMMMLLYSAGRAAETLSPLGPKNPLETAIIAAKAGRGSIDAVLYLLLKTDLTVACLQEVKQDGSGFAPLMVTIGGARLMVVFSDPDRTSLVSDKASYGLQMNGAALIEWMPENYGIVLNPGFEPQMMLEPVAIAYLRAKLRGTAP